MTWSRVVVVALVSCGGSNGADYIAGFDPPPVADGYTRFVTPPVTGIAPGADVEWCQWVAPPATGDMDVLDFTGEQSATGHHASLYASSESFNVGESHICTGDDLVSVSFIGSIGGEGAVGQFSKLPDGMFFRLPKGDSLMVNTHWLNATDKTVEGQAVLDVELSPPSDSRVIANQFANNGDTFSIPVDQPYSYDAMCPITQDLNLAMVADHMHNSGTSAYSEVIHADGTKAMLVSDPTWTSDEQFNPVYTRYSIAAPYILHAGDTYHTHCEWLNQTSGPLIFPDEMCAGFGYYFPSIGHMIACEDGSPVTTGPTD
jgi:hypothetical protein